MKGERRVKEEGEGRVRENVRNKRTRKDKGRKIGRLLLR